ncbi:MAG TPA: hypothetical protein VK668_19410 [Mucilaginibacter sp.]|nr:hypothetical protein [Mucilaginibacter sp.]
MREVSNHGTQHSGPALCSVFVRLFYLFFCFLTVPGISYAGAQIAVGKSDSTTVSKDSIVSVQNLGTQRDSSKIKEVIAIKLSASTNIDSLTTLYADGIPVPNVKPWKINYAERTLYFRLDENVQDMLLKFLESSPFEKSILAVHFGVGNAHKYIPNIHAPLYVEVRQKISHWWIWLAAIALLILAVVSLKNNILKDDNNLYYSLGRTQLFYWTVLVLIAYLSICLKMDTLPDLPLSVLALLGISVATTAAAKLIENTNKSGVKIDKNAKSEGFFLDILSDGSSINIQRFQNVAFNLFFGIIFLQKAFGNHIMPAFDQDVLILMGISSAAYAGLKNSEATKEQNELPKPTGDDNAEPSKTPGTPPGGAGQPSDPVPENKGDHAAGNEPK